MKIAVMSFAHLHATSYLRSLSQRSDVEVLTSDPDHRLRPPDETGGASLAAELGVAYVGSYAELLAWGPDAVLVCSENARHRELVERAAGSGAHVLCEKPLATTLTDARAMIEACSTAGVHLMVAHPVRFSPAFLSLKAAYDAGMLGQVVAVTGTNNGRLPTGTRAWFTDRELAGGGSLMDHTVHVADLLDCLFGGSVATSVYAATNRVLHGTEAGVGAVQVEHAEVGDEQLKLELVETGGLVSLEYDNGVIATIDCSWSKPDSYPTWGGLTLQLVGSAGIADLDTFGTRVDGHSESARNGLWLPYGPDLDQLMLAEFLDAVLSGRPPQPDGEVGFRTLQTVLAAYRSAESAQPVGLPAGRDQPGRIQD